MHQHKTGFGYIFSFYKPTSVVIQKAIAVKAKIPEEEFNETSEGMRQFTMMLRKASIKSSHSKS